MTKIEVHKTVLLKEAIKGLNPKNNGIYIDATLGSAGHSIELCNQAKGATIIGIDGDADAIKRSKEKLEKLECKFILKNFSNHLFDQILEEENISKIDGILLDLGMSSNQLEESNRGFSFLRDEPLLMTFKKNPDENDLTAKEILNNWDEENIADIIFGYGDEKFSRRIAKEIVAKRKEKTIETTFQLVEIINNSVPKWYSKRKIHPATKTFQALRITVNNEIENLKITLGKASKYLKDGGRIVVITFHSLEDRVVKNTFKKFKQEGLGTIITKKPLTPSKTEITSNPRSRSAKLRIFEINNENNSKKN